MAKVWIYRVLAAVVGVGIVAITGLKTDSAHFGAYFPLVAAIQVVVLTVLGNLVKKWGE